MCIKWAGKATPITERHPLTYFLDPPLVSDVVVHEVLCSYSGIMTSAVAIGDGRGLFLPIVHCICSILQLNYATGSYSLQMLP